ncbi:3'(2'),5'-bisphosphate nucleotidase CysQ [Paralimibaculum aggregatum]|uniref:3'(2'),5'-bisphosphate nucleotidase CysQ n=1 Tax=Paralimibaculum aggregatum TaxID=3036245 RepID=A0ABQ6LEM4_9RHOB|nr:3'(2'),5'-bisphosphate nucleotidase CysQ [Limibaculum sp. NKW23]GMG81797.1 3'(2'),5'-bisphosphate nucleotidase CysQ [Limibaculum sp. NKW23]
MPEPALQSHAADRALLVAAAEEAGRIARRMQGGALRQWDKPGAQGPVSEADLAVNAALKARLRPARPEYGWLSEEEPDDRGGAARLFVVDPIDGTRAFLAGEPGFSISVAVVEGDRVVAGAVHLPMRRETYAAHLGGGAALGGQVLAMRDGGRPEGAEALVARPNMAPEHWPGGVPGLVRRMRSSLAWRLCLVAAGRFDVTLTFRPAWEWDIAAGSLIAAEAGCRVTDSQGAPLAFNGAPPRVPGMIVAGPALHAALMTHRRAP